MFMGLKSASISISGSRSSVGLLHVSPLSLSGGFLSRVLSRRDTKGTENAGYLFRSWPGHGPVTSIHILLTKISHTTKSNFTK